MPDAYLPAAFEEYVGQREDAARSLLKVQNGDDGWGLSHYGASSLVNTAEVRQILTAAGIRTPAATAATQYLVRTLRGHFGELSKENLAIRGPNLRYIAFTLDGLTTEPEILFSPEGQAVLADALRWFSESFIGDALPPNWIPEFREAASFHVSARALAALSKIIALDGRRILAPALHETAMNQARKLATFLLTEQDEETGGWRASPDPIKPDKSFAKTAVIATALGYFSILSADPRINMARRSAARWLLENHDRWRGSLERDDQELGASWVYCAYAECVRPVASLGPEAIKQLRSSWQFMVKMWNERQQSWSEPLNRKPGDVTIRAAYHTVLAFESALPNSRLFNPPALPPEEFGVLERVERIGSAGYVGTGSRGTFALDLSGSKQLNDFVQFLLGYPEGISSEAIAQALGLVSKSVATYKIRVNTKVREQSNGQFVDLVVSEQVGARSYRYRLNTKR